ncbi:VOC family protein [Frankia sp. CNm7]|uniref:VOC family protein n=1 Tax=Frankia nepalensis TaxID=1836974 RepID=A0A937UP92_9ACTN|nr:VOC family protein [Frankia nepalensis]MBL7500840.1 VOC family protein [Frankia nepalensis]MBL7509206.1 VOC family protein [Frankia nepalensis]MBL7519343.1 VOC family protein [Frankia nepalensis]MBL7627030.1 VOC family protein [Frankia nepalensis]
MRPHPGSAVAPAVLPGAVRQIGYVVRDLDQALASWLALGVGPWYVMRGQSQSGSYRGRPCTVPLSIAFGNTGDLQVELICQEDDTPSIYTEFLESGSEGFHQLAWWTTDFDATMRSVDAAGWPVVWSGDGGGAARYAYVEPPAGPATIVEIMEVTAATDGIATLVHQAASGWDGRKPLRTFEQI